MGLTDFLQKKPEFNQYERKKAAGRLKAHIFILSNLKCDLFLTLYGVQSPTLVLVHLPRFGLPQFKDEATCLPDRLVT